MMQPTPEDLARDAGADMAVCDKATEGPWIVHNPRPDLGSHESRHCGPQYSPRLWAYWDNTVNNINFAALARTALPAWIRREVAAKAEIARLKAGKFTEEEFQNLCHNFSEDNICRFFQGCAEYQKKLFGRCHVEELQAEVATLREINAGFAKRIAAQSDQLSQNAERSNALVLQEREACAQIAESWGSHISAEWIRNRTGVVSEDTYEPCGECGVECVLKEGYCKGCEKEARV